MARQQETNRCGNCSHYVPYMAEWNAKEYKGRCSLVPINLNASKLPFFIHEILSKARVEDWQGENCKCFKLHVDQIDEE